MTGYANASAGGSEAPDGGTPTTPAAEAVHAELRSVNSRFLDLAFRLPEDLRALEPALRELIAARVRRGKVELRVVTRDEPGSEAWPEPRPEQLAQLARLQAAVQGALPQAVGLSVDEALHWCRAAVAAPRRDDAALEATRRAIAGLLESREREGARLVDTLTQRLRRLRELAAEAVPLLPRVVERQRQRFLERWNEALSADGASSLPPQAAQDRALAEATAFAIRIDVAEELARLQSHLDEIDRLLTTGGEIGKRLDFLIQELQREANTLGSKSAALELTQLSVEMKVAIEQMREQVQNIE